MPPLVVIGLTELPNSGWAIADPAHPLAAELLTLFQQGGGGRFYYVVSIYWLAYILVHM